MAISQLRAFSRLDGSWAVLYSLIKSENFAISFMPYPIDYIQEIQKFQLFNGSCDGRFIYG